MNNLGKWKYGRLMYVGKRNELLTAILYWRNVILVRINNAKRNGSVDDFEYYDSKLSRAEHLISIINEWKFYVFACYEDCMDLKNSLMKFNDIDD